MNKQKPDYYSLLHVSPDAPEEIIRSSYRTLMQRMKLHPDLGGDHETATLINRAYATLTDPVKRADYDRDQRTRCPEPSQRSPAPAPRKGPRRTGDYEDTVRSKTGGCLFCAAPIDFGVTITPDSLCPECGSPLAMPLFESSGSKDSRSLDRFSRRQTIVYYEAWPATQPCVAETRDISPNGMLFVSKIRLSENQVIKIDCPVCLAVARVAHVEHAVGGWSVGVEFIALRFNNSQGSFVSALA